MKFTSTEIDCSAELHSVEKDVYKLCESRGLNSREREQRKVDVAYIKTFFFLKESEEA